MATAGEFRAYARARLNSTANSRAAPRSQWLGTGGERVLVLDSGHLGAGQTVDAWIIVRGDFSCGPGCTFRRPVFVSGDCEIEKGSRLAAIATDGRLTLGASVEACEWVDSTGILTLHGGATIGGAAVSATAIHAQENVEARGFMAPEIVTHAGVGAPASPNLAGAVDLGPPSLGRTPPSISASLPGRWRALDRHTWSYCGDLFLDQPILLRANLFIEGMFSCPAGSMLEGDVHSTGAMWIEANSLVRATLTTHSDLTLGAGTVFQSKLRCGGNLRLSCGVRGLSVEGPVEASAGGRLEIHGSVVVRGTLIAEAAVAIKRAEPLPHLSLERLRYPATA